MFSVNPDEAQENELEKSWPIWIAALAILSFALAITVLANLAARLQFCVGDKYDLMFREIEEMDEYALRQDSKSKPKLGVYSSMRTSSM